ncbi:hypothetical protein KI387_025585, partial [Taxus chinensis]
MEKVIATHEVVEKEAQGQEDPSSEPTKDPSPSRGEGGEAIKLADTSAQPSSTMTEEEVKDHGAGEGETQVHIVESSNKPE